jgi:hypothetical protein
MLLVVDLKNLSIFGHREGFQFQSLCCFQKLETSLKWLGPLANGPRRLMAACPGQLACMHVVTLRGHSRRKPPRAWRCHRLISLPHASLTLIAVTEGRSQPFFRYRASPRSFLTMPLSLLLAPAPLMCTAASSLSKLSLTANHRAKDHPKLPAAKSQTPAAPSATEVSPAIATSGHDLAQPPPPHCPPVLRPPSRTVSCPPRPPEDLPHCHSLSTDPCRGSHYSGELLLTATPKSSPPPFGLALAPLPDLAALPAHRQSAASPPSHQRKLHLPYFFEWATSRCVARPFCLVRPKGGPREQ